MVKVLVLNGSPKGEQSNTMRLTRAFLAGAGWDDAKIINVNEAEIGGCEGCFSCWNITPGRCVIKDGMGEILAQIIAADVIVWSFPLLMGVFTAWFQKWYPAHWARGGNR